MLTLSLILQVQLNTLSSPNGFSLGTDPVYNSPVLTLNASVRIRKQLSMGMSFR